MFNVNIYTKRSLLVANGIMLVLFGASYLRLPPQIPFWYSRIEGDGQIAPWWMIFTLPLMMNAFVLLNVFLQRKFFAEHEFVSTMIRVVNMVIMVVVVLLFVKILSLVVL